MNKAQLNGFENLAQKLRAELGISVSEPIHTKTILRKENIITMYRPMSDSAFGLSLKYGNDKFMLINSNTTRGRQHFTIAHELYHLYVEEFPKPHICNGGKSKEEACADAFASAFLMPAQGLLSAIPIEEMINDTISIATILKLEQYFSVSRTALLVRLCQINLLSQTKYNQLLNEPIKQSAIAYGYDTALYENGNEGLVIGDFGTVARNLFDSNKISEGNYRELLNQISDGKD